MSSLIDDPDARRHEPHSTISVEPTVAVDPRVSGAGPDADRGPDPGLDPHHAAEIRRLREQLDEVTQQLLVARDAALGADAERSVARARVSELEHHLHVREVEVEELTVRLRALTETMAPHRAGVGPEGGAGELARQAGSIGRRTAGRLADRMVGRLNEQVTGR